jgi:hypothetical protein
MGFNINNFNNIPPPFTGINFASQDGPAGLERMWQQIRNYKLSPAERAAFEALAAIAVAKVSDEVVNQLKLWKYKVREQKAASAINQGHWDSGNAIDNIIQFFSPKSTQVDEYFRFDNQDIREKILFLSAAHDHPLNFALNPELVKQILSSLDREYDLKFSVVRSYQDVCREIEEGAKLGQLTNVLIEAHGLDTGQGITLSVNATDPKNIKWELIDESILKSNPTCFSGLHPLGRILLMSCCTGSPAVTGCGDDPRYSKRPPGTKNIAESLSEFAQNTVIAPTISIRAALLKINSTFSGLMLFHPDTRYNKSNDNVFKIFKPKARRIAKQLPLNPNCFSKGCADLNKDHLHPRELAAIDAITNYRWWNFFGKTDFQTTQEYLRLRADDPREKWLYLSAKEDLSANGWMHPKWQEHVLDMIDTRYDLKYKVVESVDDICREIEDAVKTGKLQHVTIRGAGLTDQEVCLSNCRESKKGWLHKRSNFSCFTHLQPSGSIYLNGDGTSKDHLAQILADQSQRTVENIMDDGIHTYSPSQIAKKKVEL